MKDIKFAIQLFVLISTSVVILPGVSIYLVAKEIMRPKTTEEIIWESVRFKRACPKYFPQAKDITDDEVRQLIEKMK